MCLSIRSNVASIAGKGRHSLTSKPRCQHSSQNSRSRCSRDQYNFDFLTLSEDARERELESGLLEHLRKFLLELGVGFAFVGSQYPIEVGGEDFKLDLLLLPHQTARLRGH